jgi:hypothetical protein
MRGYDSGSKSFDIFPESRIYRMGSMPSARGHNDHCQNQQEQESAVFHRKKNECILDY